MSDTSTGSGLEIPGISRGLSILLTAAAGILVVGGLHIMSSVIAPMFLAAVIVVVLSPILTALTKRGAPTWVGATALFLAALGVLVAIFLAVGWAAFELASLVTSDEYGADLAGTRDDVGELLQKVGVTEDDLEAAVNDLDVGAAAGRLASALSGVLGILSAIGLVIFTLVFAAMDANGYQKALGYIDNERPTIVEAIYGFVASTRSYFFVSTVFGLIVAVIDVVGLLAFGIPLAFVWGVLAFITNYIPNVGFVIGLIPPALLALIGDGWETMLWVIIFYSVVNVVIQSIIQPRVVGDTVGLSATLTFISLMFWGWILGPIGALLAVPLTLLAKALLIDSDPTTQWAAPLITLNVPDDADSDSSGAREG
jgi:predicted PurR-regulated permease PerM